MEVPKVAIIALFMITCWKLFQDIGHFLPHNVNTSKGSTRPQCLFICGCYNQLVAILGMKQVREPAPSV